MQRISRKRNFGLINKPQEQNIYSSKKIIIPNGNTDEEKFQNSMINNINSTKK